MHRRETPSHATLLTARHCGGGGPDSCVIADPSASTLILGPVRDTGVGPRTAEEVGIKAPPFGVTGTTVGKATVRAIRKDKAELAVLPGPGRTLRAVLDRFPILGPAMNRATGVQKTMQTIADHREREALAAR